MNAEALTIFALNTSRDFGARVCSHLNVSLQAHEEREFEDGEHKTRPLVNGRGREVFVLQSLYGEPQQSVNDKLCRLLFFLGALRDASAARVTAVVPYLCYARKDRKRKPRDPVTTRYDAMLFEAMGVDRVVTLLEKYRSAGIVSGEAVIGDVAGKVAIIIDDLISSGTTLARAAASCQAHGAKQVYAAASHGVFNSKADQVLAHPALEKIIITDTIPPFRLSSEVVQNKLMVLDAAKLFAAAIRRLHSNGSIVALLAHDITPQHR